VDEAEVARVAYALLACESPIDPNVLRDETGLTATKVGAAISRLEELAAVEVHAGGEVEATREIGADDISAAAEAQENGRAFDRSRVEMMRGYAEVRDCRREYLLNYFGEALEQPCGNCDNCEAHVVAEDPRELPFELGSRVRHET
jgi:ATP-dependent DNA helicase RecQ